MILPDLALQNHIAILGKTGAGKSHLARSIVEGLLQQSARVCIIDPAGGHWGLRSSANGKGPGFSVTILGGHHADLALGAAHGAAIAEIVGTSNTPVILDTRLFTVGDRTRFFTDFAEALLRRNKGPLHLVIDEAHLFAPQGRVNDPQSGKMLHAANNLVSLGRGVGLRVMMLTQRPAKLHKDSLTQAETLIAMRLVAPQDRNAVEDWIGEWADPKEGRELLSSLPSLATGEGWVWCPLAGLLKRQKFPRITTFDSSRAPDGDSGDGPVLAPIDLPVIEKRLGAAAEDAKASDPKLLRAEIARLQSELRKAQTGGGASAAEVQAARNQAYDFGYADGQRHFQMFVRNHINRLNGLREELNQKIDVALKSLEPAAGRDLPQPAQARPPTIHENPGLPASSGRSAPTSPTRSSTPTVNISGPQRTFLQALAWWRAVGHDAPTRVQVATICRWRVTSGHLKNVAGGLRTCGLIDYPSDGTITLTPAGAAVAPQPDLSTSLVESVRAVLTGPQRQVFDYLPRDGRARTREQVAEACGWEPTSGHVKNVLGAMRSLEVIAYPSQGQVARADWIRE